MLAGILPTLRLSDLTLDNLTPNPRYHELNRAVTASRGGPFSIHIKGLDELQIEHDNMMMESCNTSFQIHFQVGPREFAGAYNIAQAITAPVLAAAANSPIQGSAADLIKIAMIRIHDAIGRARLEAVMLLQVHDELVFEVPAAETEALSQLVRQEMEHAAELKVPLVVDVGVGDNWLTTKMD